MKATTLAPLVLIVLLAVQCKKTVSPTLPPATNTGANTFGCLVDGLMLTPHDGTRSLQSPDPVGGMQVIFNDAFKTFEIDVWNGKSQSPAPFYLHLTFTGYDKITPGSVYSWQPTMFEHEGTYGSFFNSSINNYSWFGSYQASGITTITRFDTASHIVSGTFSGTLTQRDGAHTVSITSGRFDINWATLANTKFP